MLTREDVLILAGEVRGLSLGPSGRETENTHDDFSSHEDGDRRRATSSASMPPTGVGTGLLGTSSAAAAAAMLQDPPTASSSSTTPLERLRTLTAYDDTPGGASARFSRMLSARGGQRSLVVDGSREATGERIQRLRKHAANDVWARHRRTRGARGGGEAATPVITVESSGTTQRTGSATKALPAFSGVQPPISQPPSFQPRPSSKPTSAKRGAAIRSSSASSKSSSSSALRACSLKGSAVPVTMLSELRARRKAQQQRDSRRIAAAKADVRKIEASLAARPTQLPRFIPPDRRSNSLNFPLASASAPGSRLPSKSGCKLGSSSHLSSKRHASSASSSDNERMVPPDASSIPGERSSFINSSRGGTPRVWIFPEEGAESSVIASSLAATPLTQDLPSFLQDRSGAPNFAHLHNHHPAPHNPSSQLRPGDTKTLAQLHAELTEELGGGSRSLKRVERIEPAAVLETSMTSIMVSQEHTDNLSEQSQINSVGNSALESIVQEIRARGTAVACSEASFGTGGATTPGDLSSIVSSHYKKHWRDAQGDCSFTPRLDLTRRKTQQLLGASRTNFPTVGDRLTYMAKSYEKRHQKLIDRHKTSRENEFLAIANRKKTLPKSDKMVHNVGPIGARVSRMMERRAESMERRRLEVERQALQECTFQPKLNKPSNTRTRNKLSTRRGSGGVVDGGGSRMSGTSTLIMSGSFVPPGRPEAASRSSEVTGHTQEPIPTVNPEAPTRSSSSSFKNTTTSPAEQQLIDLYGGAGGGGGHTDTHTSGAASHTTHTSTHTGSRGHPTSRSSSGATSASTLPPRTRGFPAGGPSSDFYRRLEIAARKKKEKLENAAALAETAEVEECSFRPQLCSKTAKYLQMMGGTTSSSTSTSICKGIGTHGTCRAPSPSSVVATGQVGREGTPSLRQRIGAELRKSTSRSPSSTRMRGVSLFSARRSSTPTQQTSGRRASTPTQKTSRSGSTSNRNSASCTTTSTSTARRPTFPPYNSTSANHNNNNSADHHLQVGGGKEADEEFDHKPIPIRGGGGGSRGGAGGGENGSHSGLANAVVSASDNPALAELCDGLEYLGLPTDPPQEDAGGADAPAKKRIVLKRRPPPPVAQNIKEPIINTDGVDHDGAGVVAGNIGVIKLEHLMQQGVH
ncbi:unnamed protein product [Amoebophrya sp. A25]|nr:unnamed protein product [Amoebophrya sp. A25]|eukprot:GSA25T00020327001.1